MAIVFEKPLLRIIKWDFTKNEFVVLGEMDRFISYKFALNHNDISTGELIFDPQESQAAAFIKEMNGVGWDPKKDDVFIYNRNDLNPTSDIQEWFKIEKVDIEYHQDQRKVSISGSNGFFLKDRLAIPQTNLSSVIGNPFYKDGKTAFSESIRVDWIAWYLIKWNGSSFYHEYNTTDFVAIPTDETLGHSLNEKTNRRYPYLSVTNPIMAEDWRQLETFYWGYETMLQAFNNLFKGQLEGYVVTLDLDNMKIKLRFKLARDHTNLKISQQMNNENGYIISIDSSRKYDSTIYFKEGLGGTALDYDSLSAGRYKESLLATSKQNESASLNALANQQLAKNKEYQITDVEITPLTINSLFNELQVGDVVTVDIKDQLIEVIKESQVKQMLKIYSNDAYTITPILDDNTQSVENYLAEQIWENQNKSQSNNF